MLEVFIVIELFRIAVAYMRHHERRSRRCSRPRLVAVARKFVVFERRHDSAALHALGLLALSVASRGTSCRSGVGPGRVLAVAKAVARLSTASIDAE